MISYLSTKSDISLLAAEHLINVGLHNSSIHCAYYACFQMVKHCLLTRCGYTEDTLYNECAFKRIAGGDHVCYANLISKTFKSKRLESEANEFDKEIKLLRDSRKIADYFNGTPFTTEQSREALKKAKIIIKLLQKLQ